MADPRKLKAISAAKKKSDTLDAAMLADLLRCNLLPACYVAPSEIRELRRILRYRSLIVNECVRLKNRTSCLLMEVGAEYNKEKLHGQRYFEQLLGSLEDVPESVIELLRFSRSGLEVFLEIERKLVRKLQQNPLLCKRLELLRTIPGVGEITSLTWALEISDPKRFKSIDNAVSYCGLTSAFPRLGRQDSAGTDLQAAQRPLADDPDRSRQAGAPLEPGVEAGAGERDQTRRRQPSHPRRGAQACSLPDGRGPLAEALPDASRRNRTGRRDHLGSYSELTSGKLRCPFSTVRQSCPRTPVLAVQRSCAASPEFARWTAPSRGAVHDLCDGRLRREISLSPPHSAVRQRFHRPVRAIRSLCDEPCVPMLQLLCFGGRLVHPNSNFGTAQPFPQMYAWSR